MNRILLLINLCLFRLPVFSQKPPINYSTSDNWPEVNARLISNDGNFVCYTMGTPKSGSDLIIQSTKSAWKKVIRYVGSPMFTEDSRFFLYRTSGDSLGLVRLSNDSIYFIADIASFKIAEKGGGQWLAYQRKGPAGELVLRNLANSEDTHFTHVVDYSFSNTGKILLVKTASRIGDTDSTSLVWHNTSSGNSDTIYSGGNAINFAFDNDERRLAFLAEATEGNGKNYSLWNYQSSWPIAELLCDRSSPGMEGVEISPAQFVVMSKLHSPYFYLPIPSFGNNDSTIFFGIRRPAPMRQKDSVDVGAQVTVWNLRSAFPLTSADIGKEEGDRTFPAAICFDRDKGANINILQQTKDDLAFYMPNERTARFIVTRQRTAGRSPRAVATAKRYDIYLTSVIDGNRKLITGDQPDPFITVSLTGKYIVWYDWDKKAYFSYNTATAITKNITGTIPVPLTETSSDPGFPPLPGVAGWLERDTALLINDAYNIWKIDPAGSLLPVNLTAPLAGERRIIFAYLHFDNNDPRPIDLKDSITVSAFDTETRRSAILQIGLGRPGTSHMPLLNEKTCYFPTRYLINLSGLTHPFEPLKAGNTGTYLVERMDATEYPNLYTTKDFRSFAPVTSLSPQKKFNWYTVELMHWRMLDGRIGDGLLYKPENFDSSHHYPVLIYCYERNSDALHLFLRPALSPGIINIPFFTSNGYIVFVPDISYRAGHVGGSAYNAVVSAAAFLAKKRWVDPGRIGLQGHSFGGFETNYIITRTHLFAAACSGAGPSDAVSLYGGLYESTSEHHLFETGQFRMGASLWDRPDLYIENSPVFKLDKITTPLLIMHNKGDRAVDWYQAVEWFTGLQHQGKKAWLVEYDGESHSLIKRNDQLDFTIRMRQFFDHYLMNTPAPGWMNE